MINSMNEAQAFSQLNHFARVNEYALFAKPVYTVDELSHSMYSGPVAEAALSYQLYLFEGGDLATTLDRNSYRSGGDPFITWLNESGSQELLQQYEKLLTEGIWDVLKQAGEKVVDTVGGAIKGAGAALLRQFPWGEKVIEFLKAFTEGGSAIGVFHLLLDIIGSIPASWIGIPIDVVANVLNGLIYWGRGFYFNAVLSFLFALPLGNILKGLKYTFAKPFKAFSEIVRGTAAGDKQLVKEAATEFKKLADAKPFLEQVRKVWNGAGQKFKEIIGGIILFFKKFLPDSWITKIESWMTRNLDKPLRSMDDAIKISDEFMRDTKNFGKLETGGETLAHGLQDSTYAAKQGAKFPTKAGTIVTKEAGSVLADEATKIATSVTGKVSRAEMDSLVRLGDAEKIGSIFKEVGQSSKLTKTEKTLVDAFAANPKVYMECQKTGKNLNRAIEAILKNAGKSGKRKVIKLARLAVFIARDWLKTQTMCVTGGPLGKFYNLGLKYADTANESLILEADGDAPIDNGQYGGQIDSDQQASDRLNKQMAQLKLKNADPAVKEEATKKISQLNQEGPCASGGNVAKKALADGVVTSIVTSTPYGDATPASDTQNNARFEELVNPTLQKLGLPEVHQMVYQQYYNLDTKGRAGLVDVIDPSTGQVSVTKDQAEEDARFEKFIKEESERTGLPEDRVRAIVNGVKKDNDQLDQKLGSAPAAADSIAAPVTPTDSTKTAPNESKKYVMNFEKFSIK